jgi:small GTP-binding protein
LTPDPPPAPKPSKKSWFSWGKRHPSPNLTEPLIAGNSDPVQKISAKLVLFGDAGVGKTCILTQHTAHNFNPKYRETIGATFTSATIDVHGQTVTLQLWDTGGVERFRTLVPIYCRGTAGALAVYDVTSSASFASIGRWLADFRKHAPPNAAIILVGNKTDCKELRAVSFEEGQRFAEREHLLFIETSANYAYNISETFELVTAQAIERRHS